MTQNLNHYEKILSRSHSNYLAQISIDLTDANNQVSEHFEPEGSPAQPYQRSDWGGATLCQINDVLSKLTALGTVRGPLLTHIFYLVWIDRLIPRFRFHSSSFLSTW
jgi:Mg2+ and Co2+ transporter CorA